MTEDHADGPAIKVDGPNLDSLIAVRRDFVKTLPQDAWGPLLDALDRSPNPLSEFRRVVVAAGAFDKWSAMHAETIKSDIVKWARKNNVTPRDAWFHKPQKMISPPSGADAIGTVSDRRRDSRSSHSVFGPSRRYFPIYKNNEHPACDHCRHTVGPISARATADSGWMEDSRCSRQRSTGQYQEGVEAYDGLGRQSAGRRCSSTPGV